MQDFEKCLELRRKITRLEARIEDINGAVRFPRIQVMSDMPRTVSGPSINSIEAYLIRKEKYEQEKRILESELKSVWNSILSKLSACNIGDDEKRLMYLHFYRGYPWVECTAIMGNTVSKWNENKTFRVYRKIVKELQKNK